MTQIRGDSERFPADSHISGQAGLYKLIKNVAGINSTVNKLYKETTRFNYSMPAKDIFCFDDSNSCGEYFSLDLEIWEELSYSIDEQKRINVGRPHAEKDVRLFTQTEENGEFKTVDSIIMFNRSGWAELRRVRGENRGLPLVVNRNGTIWLGDRAEFNNIKIFIRRG